MLLLAPWISELRLNQAEHQNPRTRGLVPSVQIFEGVSPDFPEETRVAWSRDEIVPATKYLAFAERMETKWEGHAPQRITRKSN